MDPVTHTMVGGTMAAAGLRRATPLATSALLIGANLPDVDVVTMALGEYTSLALRRGITHGLPALVILPLLLTGSLLLWDRLVRTRLDPGRRRVRVAPLLGISYLAVATHPILDWLNNYGMRWLLPFDGRWSYGDALFIIDPWVWLALGGCLFLIHSRTVPSMIRWGVLALAMSALVLLSPLAPLPARVIWVLGIGGLVTLRVARGKRLRADPYRKRRRSRRADEPLARLALATAGIYMVLMVGMNILARSYARAALEADQRTPVSQVMVAPVPANPLAGYVVGATPTAYHTATFSWLRSPMVVLDPDSVGRNPDPRVVQAAREVPEVADYLVWSRFPFFQVEETATGYRVRVADMRYSGRQGAGSLGGLTVEMDADLTGARPVGW